MEFGSGRKALLGIVLLAVAWILANRFHIGLDQTFQASPDSVHTTETTTTFTPRPTKDNPKPTPVTVHHGPAASVTTIPLNGSGTPAKPGEPILGQDVRIQWASTTFQPKVGVIWAGDALEPGAGANLLFLCRDFVEIGPFASVKIKDHKITGGHLSIGADLRFHHVSIGIGPSVPFNDLKKVGVFLGVFFFPI